MSNNCVFCKIVNRTQSANIVYDDNEIMVFEDIRPATKFHMLIVPHAHLNNAKTLKPEDRAIVEKMIEIGNHLLSEKNCDKNDTIFGFHWPPFNSVQHLHMHMISRASEMSFLSRMIFKPNSWWFVTPEYVLSGLIPTSCL